MKIKKIPVIDRLLIAVGLLLTSTVPMVHNCADVPDFVAGTAAGVGIGLELTALIRIGRTKKANSICSNN